MSSRLLECMSSMRPTRSRLSRVEFKRPTPRLQLAGIDAAEGERAHEGVVHDLEGQHRQGFVVRGPAGDFLFGLVVELPWSRDVHRRGQVIDHRVQQGLNALVLEGRAAEDRGRRRLEARPCAGSASAPLPRALRRRGRLPWRRRRVRRRSPPCSCGLRRRRPSCPPGSLRRG